MDFEEAYPGPAHINRQGALFQLVSWKTSFYFCQLSALETQGTDLQIHSFLLRGCRRLGELQLHHIENTSVALSSLMRNVISQFFFCKFWVFSI